MGKMVRKQVNAEHNIKFVDELKILGINVSIVTNIADENYKLTHDAKRNRTMK